MRCLQCNGELPAEAAFCPGCGVQQVIECTTCGTANALDHKFCKKCGRPLSAPGTAQPDSRVAASPQSYTPKHLADKILTSRSALQGERKQVTVLFADVSGFTGLSERLDPEEVHQLMKQAFDLMLAEVHRYEGTVNQFLGDGIMALFGAPIGHEDHAVRAVHAALGIREALRELPRRAESGASVSIRQGLNTGLVVVGSIGNDLRMDYTAVGDTTNVAARLQQTAQPGSIVISESTYRLVSPHFHLRGLEPLRLKGKAEPVGAWAAISRRAGRSRIEVSEEQGLSPFVGRESEIRTLLECFEKARAGQGQVVFVVGEAGIGKSRLLYEFRRRLSVEFTWLEGHCISFGRSIAFHAMINLLKRNFRIEDGDAEETVARKIDQGVLSLGEDLRPTLPFFRTLLAVDPGEPSVGAMDPRQRRAETFNALRMLIARAAEIQTQIIVFEDLHWMDAATQEYLAEYGANNVPANRALCILTYRTGYVHPFGERSYYTRLGIGALSTDAGAQMTRTLFGADRLPDEVESLIMAKSEGNPFFVEEVVKSLRELGFIRQVGGRYDLVKPLDQVTVPDTIQDVITARIDRLGERAKKTLQAAAVIGRDFNLALLEQTLRMADGQPADVIPLKQMEFVYEKRIHPEQVYTFAHSLTQEVAYESLLLRQRQELHGIIATLIESSAGEHLAEAYPVLAHHYSHAQDPAKAVEYLVKAGDRAVSLYANTEAVGHYTEALKQLDKQAPATRQVEQRIDVIIRLCGISGSLVDFERDLRNLGEALRLAHEVGDAARESQIYYWTGRIHFLTGRFASGAKHAEQALALADSLADDTLAAMPVNLLGRLYFLSSDFEKSVRMLERSAVQFERDGNRVELAKALGCLGWSLSMIGEFGRAVAEADRGVAVAREVADFPTEAACCMYRACVRFPLADWLPAIEDLRQALSIAERLNDAFRVYLTNGFLGGFLAVSGKLTEGIALLDRALQAAELMRTTQGRGTFQLFRAEAALAAGEVAESARHALQAIELAVAQGDRWCQAWGRRIFAEALVQSTPQDLDAAHQQVVEAIRLQREIGARPDLARSLMTQARVLHRRGRQDEARASAIEATSMFNNMGMTWDLARNTTRA